MRIIKELSEMIDDELDGAEDYAKQAVILKDQNPGLAKTFYDISLDEMKHINMLHDEVKKIIENHRKEKGDPPTAMLAIYDFVHQKHIAKANAVKMYQAQYKESVYS